MKKIFALLLAMAMVLSFAACGGSSEKGNKNPDKPSSKPMADVNDFVAEVDGADEESAETPDTSTFTIGEISGRTYENPFFNLAFDLPDSSWSFAAAEEIEEVSGVAMDMVGEEYAEAVKNGQVVYGMMASAGMKNTNVCIEKLPAGYEDIGVDEYGEIAIQNAETMLVQAGASGVDVNKTVFYVSGEKMSSFELNYTLSNMKVYQKMFFVINDGYVCSATATAVGADEAEDILSAYYLMY